VSLKASGRRRQAGTSRRRQAGGRKAGS